MTALTVSQVLKAVEDEEAMLPTINVDRSLDQEKDLGNLLAWDENEVDLEINMNKSETNREDCLKSLARDNTQVKHHIGPMNIGRVLLQGGHLVGLGCNVQRGDVINFLFILQLLFNALWSLPTEKIEEALCIKIPPSTYQLPREKPAPKPKSLTKWEAYAKLKGIDKKSKKAKGGEEGKGGRLVWDDQVREWLPKFGYKKANAEQQKNWMMEIKVHIYI